MAADVRCSSNPLQFQNSKFLIQYLATMGNHASKPKLCSTYDCKKAKKAQVEEEAYQDMLDELAIYPTRKDSTAKFREMVQFQLLGHDPFPPTPPETRCMTRKGYVRVSYAAQTAVYKEAYPGAQLCIPICETQYSFWSPHGSCHRDAVRPPFRIAMVRQLMLKTLNVLDEEKKAACCLAIAYLRDGRHADYKFCRQEVARKDLLSGQPVYSLEGVLEALLNDWSDENLRKWNLGPAWNRNYRRRHWTRGIGYIQFT
ncbi:uncharacterized protein IWZ02DRAFT_493150 [Phyllosticta citriasiana]|uniref:uncharacterized protein n=1 Tax=Phyllosticta citriasiana TaxID=595635 RepID=UPI0030FDD3A1